MATIPKRRFLTTEREENLIRKKQSQHYQMCIVAVSLLWDVFGMESFSEEDYYDNVNYIDPRDLSEEEVIVESLRRAPDFDTMIRRGFIVKEADFFRLSDSEVRRLLQ